MKDSEKNLRYYAFISYRHAEMDRKWAKWLHSRIETYRIPKRLMRERKLPSRIRPIFRDEEELAASSNLSEGIEKALQQSNFLIVVCSPKTPESEWINKEVVRFRELGRDERILSLLIAGEPSDSFPPALREIRQQVFEEGWRVRKGVEVIEPLAADVRPLVGESSRYRKRMALLRIMAAVVDCDFDELRRRDQERRTRNLFLTGAALAFLSAVLLALSMYALSQRERARLSDQESRQRLVRVTVANGRQLADRGDWLGALAWFVEALRVDESDAVKERIHRMRLGSFVRQSPELVQILFHEGAVRSAEFDKSGRRVVTASNDRTARVWDATSGEPLSPPLKAQGNVSVVRHALFSPDGRWVATESEMGLDEADELQDNVVQVWDTTTWQPAATIRHMSYSSYNWLSFSPDSRRILTIGREARVWDVVTGKPVSAPMTHGQDVEVGHAAFSPNGLMVATGGDNGDVRVWDAETGKALSSPMRHANMVYSEGASGSITHVEFSSDNKKIVASSIGGTACVWGTNGRRLTEPLRHVDEVGNYYPVAHATFSINGELIATAGVDGAVRVWDAKTGKLISQSEKSRSGRRDYLNRVSFSPDGTQVLSASADRIARIWNADSGSPVSSLMLHGDVVNYVNFSPDGKQMVTASEDGAARVWRVPSAEANVTLQPVNKEEWLEAARFSPDGRRLAVMRRDGTLQLWNTLTWESESIATGLSNFVSPEIIWGRDTIIVSSHGQGGGMWDIETKRPIPIPEKVGMSCWAICRDEKRVAASNEDGGIEVLDAMTWEPISPVIKQEDNVFTIPGNEELYSGLITHVAFSQDCERVVVTNYGSTVRVWDVRTGQPLTPAIKHLSPKTSDDEESTSVPDAEFSPDGRWVVTASADRTARIWDAKTGTAVSPPFQHDLVVRRATFSADGLLVATVSADGSARVWDVATGEAVTPPLEHDIGISDAVFCESGECLLTVSENYSVKFWNLTPDSRLLERIRLYSQASAFRAIDATQGFVPLVTDDLKTIWKELR